MKFMLALIVFSSGVAPGFAETLLRSPTPEEIDAAIALVEDDAPADHWLKNSRVWMRIETPFLRLAHEVLSAKARALPVDRRLATELVLAPELRIVAGPEPRRDDDVEILEIVAERPDGSVIPCAVLERFTDRAQTSRRKGIKLQGLSGTLPVEVLERGVTFRFKLKKHPDVILSPASDWFDEAR